MSFGDGLTPSTTSKIQRIPWCPIDGPCGIAVSVVKISLWIWYFYGQMCSYSHGDVRYCKILLWYMMIIWVIHGYTILPLYNPFTKKGGSYFLISPHGWFHSSPKTVAPFSTKGLEEDDARCSVRWMLDACERRFAPGTWHETFMAWVQRRARREPVQYIVGSAGPKVGTFTVRGYLGNLGDGDGMYHPQWILVFWSFDFPSISIHLSIYWGVMSAMGFRTNCMSLWCAWTLGIPTPTEWQYIIFLL